MQNASAIHYEAIGIDAGLYAQSQVLFQFLLQALLDVTGGYKFTVLAEEGAVVNHEEHAHGGLVHGDGRQSLGILEIGNGISDFEAFDTHYGADVTALDLVHIGFAQAFEDHELLDFALFYDVVALAKAYGHAGLEGATGDAAHGDTAHIGAVL